MRYRGRFAPSPTGPLHAGSLVAAVASWLDARAQGGVWLVRIEDIDTARCEPGAAPHIVQQLAACGLVSDELPWLQSQRGAAYALALQKLLAQGQAFACACSRKDIALALSAQGLAHEPARPPERRIPKCKARRLPGERFGELIYPGTCRQGLNGKLERAVRFRAQGIVRWFDRRLGQQQQDLTTEVGDFVLRRADGLWAYQLAVVVDDAAQAISHVVRGQDLADNTARQTQLQRALGLPTPAYLHTPLVLAADGHKLSKQNGAQALDLSDPVAALQAAGRVLGLPNLAAPTPAQWLAGAVPAWAGIIRAFDSAGEND